MAGQQLPFSARDQLDIFRTFAVEVAEGAAATTDLLELCMAIVRQTLDRPTVAMSVEKLKSHPLIERSASVDSWNFKQEQIRILLIAEQLVEWEKRRIHQFVNKARMDPGSWQDLATMVVDMLMKENGHGDSKERLHGAIDSMSVAPDPNTVGASDDGGRLAGIVALTAVERILPKGTPREERANLLALLCGGAAITNITFIGTIAGYDFRESTFRHCRFERLSWANCRFSESTKFIDCQFMGGAPPVYCEGFGSATMQECRFDPEAEAILNGEKIKEGRRRYNSDDLRNDIYLILNRFIIKGGIGLKTIEASMITRGPISTSRHRDEIIETLRAMVLEEHHLNNSMTGYNIRSDAVESIKFYAANNVFTGPLRDAYEKLKEKLHLE